MAAIPTTSMEEPIDQCRYCTKGFTVKESALGRRIFVHHTGSSSYKYLIDHLFHEVCLKQLLATQTSQPFFSCPYCDGPIVNPFPKSSSAPSPEPEIKREEASLRRLKSLTADDLAKLQQMMRDGLS